MTKFEIDAFLAVISSGSLTAAAQQLYITQPALSRRLRALEAELDYTLFRRGKGIRTAELTEEGRAFIPIAQKYDALWKEARALPENGGRRVLRLSSVGSVASYLLPEIFSSFMARYPQYSLQFQQQHSLEAYAAVAHGDKDLALISDQMFSREVQTVPLFREEMALALSPGTKYRTPAAPAELDGRDEIRLPWNPEYDIWHNYWFPSSQRPRVQLDQMSLLEYFLRQEDLWAIIPVSAGPHVAAIPGLRIRPLPHGPAARHIYYLAKAPDLPPAACLFLDLLTEKLRATAGITLLQAHAL